MRRVKVDAIGQGIGANRYPRSFDFIVKDTDSDQKIAMKARIKAQKETGCDFITITRLEIVPIKKAA